MTYQETLNYLFDKLPMFQRTGKAAYKEGLENTFDLDRYFNSPHKKYKTIHIAGTNGKGSVCHMLASVLQQAGYKVGLHTSPHILDFRERIRVNGMLMDKGAVVEFVEKHQSYFEKLKPSFFEMSVFMAFDYFAQSGIDVGIIETGLGGRLDSTNIITPVVSVITNIGFDHTEFLGDTFEKIAAEKAGIIKDMVPVVIGEHNKNTKPVFDIIAKIHNSPVFYAQEKYQAEYSMLALNGNQLIKIRNRAEQKDLQFETDLLGLYQRKNLVTVLTALDVLLQKEINFSHADILEGLKNVKKSTGLRGRWDICGYNPMVVCDTGHNTEGVAEVIKQIRLTPYKNLHVVVGFVADKDISSILELLPREAFYYFTRPSVPRGLDYLKLSELAKNKGLKGKPFSSVKEAVGEARANASVNDLIFVGGSTFIVADFLASEKV